MATLDDSPSLFSGQQWSDWADAVGPDIESGKFNVQHNNTIPIFHKTALLVYQYSDNLGHVCHGGNRTHLSNKIKLNAF